MAFSKRSPSSQRSLQTSTPALPSSSSSSGPSSPRQQPKALFDIAQQRPNPSQPRLNSSVSSSKHINIVNNHNKHNFIHNNTSSGSGASTSPLNSGFNHSNMSNNHNSQSISGARATSPPPLFSSSSSTSSVVQPGSAKHVHTLSANISYPHPSIHPPLRLLTTATCDTYTSLVSAQSPPQSPTFSSFGSSLPLTTSTSITQSSSSGSSRANSILDGIQNALANVASSPPIGTIKHSSSSSSTYSAAKDSLSDFSIAPSTKRAKGQNNNGNKSNKSQKHGESGGVIRSNYVSFPNFDDIDFVDVAMVDDDDEEDEDHNGDWSGPDSPPEGQRPIMDSQSGQSPFHSSLDEKRMMMMRPPAYLHPQVSSQPLGYGLGESQAIESRISSLGMPTSPSQHWLLQLETCHELRVNGSQV
ncbi:hypothetical protein BGZ83_010888 [Gryganskiella cystojenkinii]|nr:hypothetical protein BGZ83_010888 [Gryganskiella cystojenkinii]